VQISKAKIHPNVLPALFWDFTQLEW